MIGIIDYGLGNINAISNIYNKLKIKNLIIKSKKDFEVSEKLILPGVGAFDSAMNLLYKSDLILEIENQILNKKKKLLGICVGMQIFANKSEEGTSSGLNFFDAEVKKINNSKQKILRLPHMGWNSINFVKDDLLFKSIDNNEYFYFCHSYYFDCQKKENILATTNYGQFFSSVVKNKNIYGIQFHPEKSHDMGVKILDNFAKL